MTKRLRTAPSRTPVLAKLLMRNGYNREEDVIFFARPRI